jgi:hypothetical protein
MQKRNKPRPFTEEELDFIRENVMTKSIKELAYELKRPYASVYTQAALVRSKLPALPKYKLVKKKYTFTGEPPKPTIQRPPAVYSNKTHWA